MTYSRHVAETLLDLARPYGDCGCTAEEVCSWHRLPEPTPRANALFRDITHRLNYGTRADVERGIDQAILTLLHHRGPDISPEDDAQARAVWLS